MKRLVVIGAGGFGRGVIDIVRAINKLSPEPEWRLLGIYDDFPSAINLRRMDELSVPYLGVVPKVAPHEPTWYVVGINNPNVRKSIVAKLDALGWWAASLVHPEASIETERPLGEGVIVRAGVRVATNSCVGRHVHLNYNVVLGHDVVLGDFVSVNPIASIAGEVHIGECSVVGTNATVLQGQSVGAGCIVGASACITKTFGPDLTLVGVPAQVVNRKQN